MDATRLAERLIGGEVAPGIYRLIAQIDHAALADRLATAGWRLFVIDGKMVQDKAGFLEAAAAGMAFPAYAGRNWDAFEELIRDLNWAPAAGYVILFDDVHRFASAQPDAWRTALAILSDTVAEWQRHNTPMIVLLHKCWRWGRHLPKLESA
jgi:hypothetical protein